MSIAVAALISLLDLRPLTGSSLKDHYILLVGLNSSTVVNYYPTLLNHCSTWKDKLNSAVTVRNFSECLIVKKFKQTSSTELVSCKRDGSLLAFGHLLVC